MCRMMAAVGRFESAAVLEALRLMASNENPAHSHEVRDKAAAFQHVDGWGAVWVEEGRLRRRRSPQSFLADPAVKELGTLRTDLLIMHARRATDPGTIRMENTHPFLLETAGRSWAFCHNGAITDLAPLRPAPNLTAEGQTDSELLFHHLLNALQLSGTIAEPFPPSPRMGGAERILLDSLRPIREYTSLHSFLATSEGVCALAARHPEQSKPHYHALWVGRDAHLAVVSSEPVDTLGRLEWRRMEEPGAIVLRRAEVR
jgi:predicted glutamine amidotransferase